MDLIAAVDLKGGIGLRNGLPWRLPEDMKHFRALTSKSFRPGQKNAVIMGRKTWESIPAKFKPLSDRLNIVLTHQLDYKVPEGVLSLASLDEVEEAVGKRAIDRCFIIGGASLYEQAIDHPLCDLLYLTQINAVFECDTFFPEYLDRFELIEESKAHLDDGVEYCFKTYRRKR